MDIRLNGIEARILGVLIEKQMATPEYYPLTLNALVNACNQKSNREPVMDLTESEVAQWLKSLRDRHLVWQVRMQGSRVAKYEHNLQDTVDLSKREQAIMCELLLRGPQTPGELRTRAGRLVEFQSLREVEYVLQQLSEHAQGPFVTKLPMQPGRKEHRFAHLFSDVPEGEDAKDELSAIAASASEGRGLPGKSDRVTALEQRVTELEAQLAEMKETFEQFRKQFE